MAPTKPAAGKARSVAAPEPFDVSDLHPTDLDRLIEETLRDLPHASPEEREQHFVRRVGRHREGRDQPAGGGFPETDYTRSYYEAMARAPQSWGDFVGDEAHTKAKQVAAAGVEANYEPATRVRIAGDDYLRHLTGTGRRVLYHAYHEHPEHGAELLHQLKQSGLDCPYDVCHVATLSPSRPDHLHDPALKSDGKHTRALLYAIAFAPRGPEEATKLLDGMAKQGAVQKVKKMSKDTAEEVPGRWQRPEILAGLPHESLGTQVVNTLPAGQQHVVVAGDDPIPGFRTHEIFRHPGVRSAAKGVSVLVLANRPPVHPVVQLGLLPPVRAPLKLCEATRDGVLVELAAEVPPFDFLVPGEIIGRRGLVLKGTALAARAAQLFREEREDLEAYLFVLGRCLKAIAATHALPPLDRTMLLVGPRQWTRDGVLALMVGDVGGMAAKLALPTVELLQASPSAARRYGAALPAVAYDYLVASRAGWPRDTLAAEEAAQVLPVLEQGLGAYGYVPAVTVVI